MMIMYVDNGVIQLCKGYYDFSFSFICFPMFSLGILTKEAFILVPKIMNKRL